MNSRSVSLFLVATNVALLGVRDLFGALVGYSAYGGFGNNCLTCHSAIRTKRHEVSYLNEAAIEEAGLAPLRLARGAEAAARLQRIAEQSERLAFRGGELMPMLVHGGPGRAARRGGATGWAWFRRRRCVTWCGARAPVLRLRSGRPAARGKARRCVPRAAQALLARPSEPGSR